MKAIIAIGTNLNQRDNALSVREYLCGMFGSDIVFTQFMKTKPVDGGVGYYINALAEINTNMSYKDLKQWFKDLEQNCGRNQEDSGDGYIPVDIDILQYGDKRFKEEDWCRDYVKALWKELRQKRK
jgi:2-amino-4-hydroxy-6-hydroxymethyldihydropteridine diphosphokinase